LKKRLKLFDASVSKTMLWCTATWTLSAKEKRHLGAVQRNMLRRFVGPRRAPDDDWSTWAQRATHVTEERAQNAGVQYWLCVHLWPKWQWALRVAHMPEDRWARRLTFWRDSVWWVGQVRGASAYGVRPIRVHGNHTMRWEDDVRRFCDNAGLGCWQDAAEQEHVWACFE
jgi:hypothetical protein